MTSTTQQDDYYAKVTNTASSGTDDKKPLKLKLKAVIKKTSDDTSPIETSREDDAILQAEKPKARNPS
jgi:hypothetical protein